MLLPNLSYGEDLEPPESRRDMQLLIVGNRGGTNVGGSFERSAHDLALGVHMMESEDATDGPAWLRRLKWHLLGRTPLRLEGFSAAVVQFCRRAKPDLLLTTGFAPIHADALCEIRRLGVCRANYLTDDPWNPTQRARWFIRALSHYDHIFTTRRSIVADLGRSSGAAIAFVPFAYDPALFYAESLSESERQHLDSDLFFAGGADADRVPYISAALQTGLRIALYGSHWERYEETRGLTRGQANVVTLRKALCATRVALCLVRRANRDGHCMRTFEVPAVGACMLVERTEEHLELFGLEGERVLYFGDPEEMTLKLQWLIEHDEERNRLRAVTHELIIGGRHTYRDRLSQMLKATGFPRS
jgi:spore maturation protein CgeB